MSRLLPLLDRNLQLPGHSNTFGERPRPHLLHHAASMNVERNASRMRTSSSTIESCEPMGIPAQTDRDIVACALDDLSAISLIMPARAQRPHTTG
jgi:hypothetical protein